MLSKPQVALLNLITFWLPLSRALLGLARWLRWNSKQIVDDQEALFIEVKYHFCLFLFGMLISWVSILLKLNGWPENSIESCRGFCVSLSTCRGCTCFTLPTGCVTTTGQVHAGITSPVFKVQKTSNWSRGGRPHLHEPSWFFKIWYISCSRHWLCSYCIVLHAV